MSKIEVDKIIPQSGTALQVGESGDTITIPAGATITNNGTANGFGSADTEKVKVSSNDTTAGFLNGKLVAGTNISLTEGSDGGNETLTAALTGTIGTSQIANSAVDLTSKVTGALPVANGGTNLTSNFKNGITVADTWRVNTGFTLNISPTDLTTNWERADTYSPGYIGTGMSESSGIFTFPQTGIYHIFNQVSFHQSGSDTHDWVYMRCYATTDNSNYNAASIGLGHIQDSADEISVCSSFIFDVTDTTTHKVKFQVSKQSGNDSVNVGASSSENRTYATFIRLGDT
jgi:hypothetical protein